METENKNENGEWETVQPKSDLWNWEENPVLEGIYIDKVSRQGRNGEFFIYTIAREGIESEDGNDVKITGGTVLDPRFANCEFGTKIKITFLGMKLTVNGQNSYRDFKIEKRKSYNADPELKKDAKEAGIEIELPEEKEEINVRDIPF